MREPTELSMHELRLLDAALRFCSVETRLREMRRGIKCTEQSDDQSPCFIETDDLDSVCDGCKKRLTEKSGYLSGVRKRSSVKARMMRAFKKQLGAA